MAVACGRRPRIAIGPGQAVPGRNPRRGLSSTSVGVDAAPPAASPRSGLRTRLAALRPRFDPELYRKDFPMVVKNQPDIQGLRRANRLTARLLRELANLARPGVRTRDLDTYAADYLARLDAEPVFHTEGGFPACINTRSTTPSAWRARRLRLATSATARVLTRGCSWTATAVTRPSPSASATSARAPPPDRNHARRDDGRHQGRHDRQPDRRH